MKAMAKRLAVLEAVVEGDDRGDRHPLSLHFWIVAAHPPGGYDVGRSMSENLGRSIGIESDLRDAISADWPGVVARINGRFVALMRERGAVLADEPVSSEMATEGNWAIVVDLFRTIPEVIGTSATYRALEAEILAIEEKREGSGPSGSHQTSRNRRR